MSDKIFLKIEGHDRETAVREIIGICLKCGVTICEVLPENEYVLSRAKDGGEKIAVTTELCCLGKHGKKEYIHLKKQGKDDKQNMTDAVKLGFYYLFTELFGRSLPWGAQTGIRPALLASKRFEEMSLKETICSLEDDFSISHEKAELAAEVALNEAALLKKYPRRGISLYIGIPFCPTRCLYCSFVSLPLSKQKKNVEPYVDALIKEAEYVGELIKREGETVDSIYIGGGTPTSLDEKQLEKLLAALKKALNTENIYEYTIEAGRADTITEEKLKIIAAHTQGDVRISINPQTLNDSVLAEIGRAHTEEQFLKAFKAARKVGFTNINCDVIAGLPTETPEMFGLSLKKLIALEPENITMHTMCVKRAARLKSSDLDFSADIAAVKSVSAGHKLLHSAGYKPYYMYRQKDTLGGLENTGYAKEGKEGIYNVFMMDDISSVVGLGAGAVTKLIDYRTNRIERIYNYKDPWEYINGFDEIIRRKRIK